MAGPVHTIALAFVCRQVSVAAEHYAHLVAHAGEQRGQVMESSVRAVDEVALLRAAFANK
jgi:hypothetical protein